MNFDFPQWHPPFDIVPLLTPIGCKWLMQVAEGSQLFEPAKVMRQDGEVGSDDRYCTAAIASFRHGSPIHKLVKALVLQHLPNINGRFDFELFDDADERLMPHVNIMRYDASNSGKFEPHVDMAGRPEVKHRKLSVVVPLNDPNSYAGGRLIINTGEQFDALSDDRSDVGNAIVFSSLTMHGVTPVTLGTRYTLVFFLQGPSFR